jgi:hypothetical protein
MSQFVTTHYVQQYTTNVQLLSQQKGSRLIGSVTQGTYVGKQGVPVDQFAPTVANKRTTRYPALTPADTQADRRWVFPSDYDWNDLIDNIDKLRLLIDPQSSYVTNGTAAMNRAKDDEIIAAFFGTAKTGVDGSVSTSFPSSQQISASEGASSATGMNVEKLKAGIQLLLQNEAWDPSSGDRINCVITAKQNRNLMDEIQVINADYNGEKRGRERRLRDVVGQGRLHPLRAPAAERLVADALPLLREGRHAPGPVAGHFVGRLAA